MQDNQTIKCGKCDAPLEIIKANGAYLGYRFPVDLPGCPVCGKLYVPEELVQTKVTELETLLEEK